MPDREYFNNRRKNRRVKFINLLGGKCERCGATDGLQFDHRRPNKKEFRISNRIDAPEDILLKEVMKCVLLCAKCHRDKTREMGEHGQPKARHGTLWMYKRYGCRCKKCKKRMSDYNRKRRISSSVENRMNFEKLGNIVDQFKKLAGDVLIFKKKTEEPEEEPEADESKQPYTDNVLEFGRKIKEPEEEPKVIQEIDRLRSRLRHHFTPPPPTQIRPAKVDPKEVLEYLEANPMATVGEAQRAILRQKRQGRRHCERCNGEGFIGLPERQQRLGRLLGRSTCPECGR